MQSYAIADCEAVPGEVYFRRAAELVEAGVDWIQLRAKHLDDCQVYGIGERLRSLTQSSGTRLMVNGRADIAAGIGANGVHLPAHGLPIAAVRTLSPNLLVGRSCHSVEECRNAAAQGADYVLLGPVFDPRSKDGRGQISRSELEQAGKLALPVFALGGMSGENVASLRGLNLAGIAAITLFMTDQEPGEIVRWVRQL